LFYSQSDIVNRVEFLERIPIKHQETRLVSIGQTANPTAGENRSRGLTEPYLRNFVVGPDSDTTHGFDFCTPGKSVDVPADSMLTSRTRDAASRLTLFAVGSAVD
jgi:hypothetical protein